MTIGSEEIGKVEAYDLLITPEFAPLTKFAGFGAYEAVAIQETGSAIAGLLDHIPQAASAHLVKRPESASLMGPADPPISEPAIKEWLDRTTAGPFDGDLTFYLLPPPISHIGEKEVTFPRVQKPLPPQLILALTAWLQGQILQALGKTCDVATVSAAGAAWTNQPGIILEPSLTEPEGPLGRHEAAEFHSYAQFAGFATKRTRFCARPCTVPKLDV
ncbi:MAG: hypothetical protein M3460_21725 [Actinomycetota bacterium]|nr:hypothetical protein [Actinomycetota bacterium]